VKSNYTDGTSQENDSRDIPDWFGEINEAQESGQSLYYLVNGLDRSKADGSGFENKKDPAIFGSKWALSDSKQLKSITLTKTSSTGSLVFLGASLTFGRPTITPDLSSVFKNDVIVNRNEGVTDTTQSAIDSSGYALITQSFAKSRPLLAVGLPDDGFFAANLFHPDIQLSYNNNNDGNNARVLKKNESLTFNVSPNWYTNVHLALTSTDRGSGSYFKLKFNYADGTSSDTGSRLIPDWFDGNAYNDTVLSVFDLYFLANGLDRAKADGSSLDQQRLAVFGAVSSLDKSKQLTSITVTNISKSDSKLVFLGATLTL
jgi:hypothetical protein